jgi:hypothetical protein
VRLGREKNVHPSIQKYMPPTVLSQDKGGGYAGLPYFGWSPQQFSTLVHFVK